MMNRKQISKILHDTAFIHTSGTPEEKKVADYLQEACKQLGVTVHEETFPVRLTNMSEASLMADGKALPCKGYKLCGSGSIKAPFCYMPNDDRASLSSIKGKIVLIDKGVSYFNYHDLLKYGAVGFITYDGDVNYADNDIDFKELRPHVCLGEKLLGVNVNAKTAARLVAMNPASVEITIQQEEYEGESLNVVAEIPGQTDEWIVLTAHMDTTPLSVGSYDNMTGCIGLLGIMEKLKAEALHYSLRFVFCGSEERGLLGSKAYVAAHEGELEKVQLNINLDMIGTTMGKFIACVSAEDKLVHYLEYLACETGWGLNARQGVYSSDSTPFADKGVPALSFARITGPHQGTIHNRYDTAALVSEAQMQKDIDFIALFTARMACARCIPVARQIPDKVRDELDKYLFRKRGD